MTKSYTIFRERFDPTDPRLGRHVMLDSRSLDYQVEASPIDTLKSIRHQRYIPVLNQGQVGSCEGNGSVGVLGSGLFWATIKDKKAIPAADATAAERVAVQYYSEATHQDPYAGVYPPTDTGTDNVSISKVLRSHGLISGYQHATSLEAALTGLSQKPALFGSRWLNNMFNPDPDGRLRITGSLAGGHAYVLDELVVEKEQVWMTNSWDLDWGIQGRAYMTFDDFDTLRKQEGEVTFFTPITAPAPTPTPPQPTPPVPPTPVDPKAKFLQAYNEFAAAVVEYTSK